LPLHSDLVSYFFKEPELFKGVRCANMLDLRLLGATFVPELAAAHNARVSQQDFLRIGCRALLKMEIRGLTTDSENWHVQRLHGRMLAGERPAGEGKKLS
jgi:hypothetical protein